MKLWGSCEEMLDMTLNNPLSLLSLKLCGMGLEINYCVTAEQQAVVDVTVDAIIWSRTWAFLFSAK